MQIARLNVIDGKTLSELVSGMMKILMTRNLQRQYNWYGQKGQKSFGALKISGIICGKCPICYVKPLTLQYFTLYIKINLQCVCARNFHVTVQPTFSFASCYTSTSLCIFNIIDFMAKLF